MKFLIYLLITTLGFGVITPSDLNQSSNYIIDKQNAVVEQIKDAKSTNIAGDQITIDNSNLYWDKVIIKGNVYVNYQVKYGTEAIIVELPDNYVNTPILQKNSTNILDLDIKPINKHEYLYLRYTKGHPIRLYKDTLNSNILHIDVAKSVNPYKYKVVIDPGHGGYEPGASYNGINEKDIVLDIALRMENKLKDAGINVIYTRTSDVFIDLSKRPQLSNEVEPDAFISIHNNANTDLRVNGISTYIYNSNTHQLGKNYKLSSYVQNNLMKEFKDWNNWGIVKDNLCVLRENDYPSILVEFGFLSNAANRESLSNPEIKDKAADAITNGIIQFVK